MADDPDYVEQGDEGQDVYDQLVERDPLRLRDRCREAEALLAEVADCGFEDIDERLWYVEVQVDKALWAKLQPFRSGA